MPRFVTFLTPSLQRLRGLRLAVAAFAVVVGLSRPSRAQSFDLQETGWEGMRGLVDLARQELGDGRVVATTTLDWQTLTPVDGLLVLHPDGSLDGEELSAFLRAGGRAAVLDDFGTGDRVLARYQIRRVPAPRAPLFSLRSNPGLALAEPVSETVAGRRGGVHPVVAEVTRLVTNHPTGLVHPDLSTVLRIRASGEADVALAVAGQVGKGRLFAMGDPSAVMNLMLRYPGNRAFARGLVRYLVDDDTWGTRQGRLVIVANRFGEKGAFGAESATSRELAEWARNLRGEVSRIGGEGLPRHVALVLAVAATAMLLLWVASSAARPYKPPTVRFARRSPLFAQGGVAGRAAVLAAPSTHRGLVLLEQKDALEEEVGVLLGMEKPPTMNALIQTLTARRLLGAELLAELKVVLLEMARVETAVSAGAPVRTPKKSVERAERVSREVVAQVTARVREGAS